MARIAIISQFYSPEPCAAANRVVAMARAFSEAGHEVRVYTAMPSFPSGILAAPYHNRAHAVERDGTIAIERVWTYIGKKGRPANRTMHWLSVAAGIALRILNSGSSYDLVVISSPPVTLALPALLLAFVRSVPLLVDVRDVFPEVGIKMGAWKAESFVAKSIGRVVDTLYQRARLITCVTESARAEIFARGASRAKIFLAPNGFDEVVQSSVPPYPSKEGARDIVFVGNMGLATGLDVVLDAASILNADSTIRFVLIGAGVDCARLRARARSLALTNVLFTGALPRPEALRALADASATIVPLVATIVDSLPTKLFDAMLVGTPIVVSASGEAKRLVELADVGLAAEPGDPHALVAALRRVVDEPGLAERFRANGPGFVREHYDRAVIMRHLATLVPELSAR